jgi:hypothetical protein
MYSGILCRRSGGCSGVGLAPCGPTCASITFAGYRKLLPNSSVRFDSYVKETWFADWYFSILKKYGVEYDTHFVVA